MSACGKQRRKKLNKYPSQEGGKRGGEEERGGERMEGREGREI